MLDCSDLLDRDLRLLADNYAHLSQDESIKTSRLRLWGHRVHVALVEELERRASLIQAMQRDLDETGEGGSGPVNGSLAGPEA